MNVLNTKKISAIALSLLVSLIVLTNIESGASEKGKNVSTIVLGAYPIDRRIEKMVNELPKVPLGALRAKKLGQLLSAYSQRSSLQQKAGGPAEAYATLLQARDLELLALHQGMRTLVATPALSQYRSKLLCSDGPGLLDILKSDKIHLTERLQLVSMLESVIKLENKLGPEISKTIPKLPKLPANVEKKIKDILSRRKSLETAAKAAENSRKRSLMREVIETYATVSQAYLEAGYPVKAAQILLEGYAKQNSEGLGGSDETSPISYDVMKFFQMTVLRNGHHLLRILHSRTIPWKRKQKILSILRHAVRTRDFPQAEGRLNEK